MRRRTTRKPPRTRKAKAKPADRKPPRTRKAEAKPADRKPPRTRKAEAKPADRKPPRTGKAEAKPADRELRAVARAGIPARGDRPLVRAAPEAVDFVSWATAQSARIRRAIARAKTLQSRPDISEDLARRLTVEIAKLEAGLARNEAEIDAAQAEEATLAPPTPGDIDKVATLVKRLDQEITNAEVARAVLGAASAILEAVAEARREG